MKIKGKKVVEAKGPLTLHIQPGDVKSGKTKMPTACAAAVAAVRQCKGAVAARVHLSRVYIEFPKEIVRYRTPAALRTEIVSFDRGHRFEAGDYVLTPLCPSERAKGKQQGSATNQTSPKSKYGQGGWSRKPMHEITGVRASAPKASNWK